MSDREEAKVAQPHAQTTWHSRIQQRETDPSMTGPNGSKRERTAPVLPPGSDELIQQHELDGDVTVLLSEPRRQAGPLLAMNERKEEHMARARYQSSKGPRAAEAPRSPSGTRPTAAQHSTTRWGFGPQCTHPQGFSGGDGWAAVAGMIRNNLEGRKLALGALGGRLLAVASGDDPQSTDARSFQVSGANIHGSTSMDPLKGERNKGTKDGEERRTKRRPVSIPETDQRPVLVSTETAETYLIWLDAVRLDITKRPCPVDANISSQTTVPDVTVIRPRHVPPAWSGNKDSSTRRRPSVSTRRPIKRRPAHAASEVPWQLHVTALILGLVRSAAAMDVTMRIHGDVSTGSSRLAVLSSLS
ncbi:hypothetical protein G7046_g4239 [Stylonectria norvegica]|nr:hypothetical protein G7046_g4239 [Stylonectria norvegica]